MSEPALSVEAEIDATIAQTPRTAAAVDAGLAGAEENLKRGTVKHETTAEEKALAEKLIAKHPGTTEFDALRFLRARDLDFAKADALLAADIAWRKAGIPGVDGALKPLDKIEQADITNALPSGCWRAVGKTKTGSMIIWVQLSLWNPGYYDLAEYQRYICYFLEHSNKHSERYVCLFDMSGWKVSHALHLRKIYALLSTVQNHYPERLEWGLMMRSPLIFAASWKLIKMAINARTASKVVYTSWKAAEETQSLMNAGLTMDVIPSVYGGEHDVSKIPVPNFPGEPDVEVVSR